MFGSDLDLSSLKTVSSFDKGCSSTMAVGIPHTQFSPSSLLVESLIEQLCKFLEKDPRNQRSLYLTVCRKLHEMNLIDTSYNMEEFQFMRSHYQKALYNLLSVTKSTSLKNKSMIPVLNIPSISIPLNFFELSRYATEFIELEFIAKGGFGNVFKVKHKLDGGIYAVKKICLRYQSRGFLNNLNEVKMLARLYHPNIVAYKAAWLEHMYKYELGVSDNAVPFISDTQSSSSVSSIEIKRSSSRDNSLEVVFETSSKVETRSSSENCKVAICKCDYELDNICEDRRYMNEWAVLYIQMQLCQATLRNWLDHRNQTAQIIDPQICLIIFRQVVSGLEYIHSQNIVHHDIKPSNIFVSDDLRVQLGDFGLACHFLSHGPSTVSDLLPHIPGRVGTELYAAPEQLQGLCHPKSDVYSLGIVLFELIYPFQTSMERSKVISQLRAGHFPTNVAASMPRFANLISQTVCQDYSQRPNCTQLVKFLDESEQESTLKRLKEQEVTIKLLRQESREKDEQIALLQQQLKKLMSFDDS